MDKIRNTAFIIVTMMTFTLSCLAETTLNASVDRSRIYETDTLTLLVTGNIELEFSFSGLMNFGRNEIDSPTLIGLENDFDILDQQQKYNMQSINGETNAQVTWTYTLAPKRSGTLTIPKAVYKNVESKPVQVTVVRGKAPQDLNNPPRVFIEVEVDKHEAYVQEQVLYTVRLYAADHLAGGDLSVPETNDAIIESLGDTKKYYRMAFNQRYEVRERQYLLFPQKSGELLIEPQTFSGTLIDSRNRKRVRIRESSEPVNISIKPPPTNFSGDTWLPATQLSLKESWDREPDMLVEGDSISRTLEINALGLLGSALPPISMKETKALKIYPDQAFVESREHSTGADAIRRQTLALVAIAPVKINLPEIRIPWWDTINDVENVAIIPARTLTIKPNPALATMQTKAEESLVNNNGDEPYKATDQNSELETKDNIDFSTSENNTYYLLLSIIVLLLFAWLSTSIWLIRRHRHAINIAMPDDDINKSSDLFDQLVQSIKNDNPDMPNYLVTWAQQLCQLRHPEIKINSLHDLKYLDGDIHHQALAFEKQRYSQGQEENSSDYSKKRMMDLVKTLSKVKKRNETPSPLIPFYPK